MSEQKNKGWTFWRGTAASATGFVLGSLALAFVGSVVGVIAGPTIIEKVKGGQDEK